MSLNLILVVVFALMVLVALSKQLRAARREVERDATAPVSEVPEPPTEIAEPHEALRMAQLRAVPTPPSPAPLAPRLSGPLHQARQAVVGMTILGPCRALEQPITLGKAERRRLQVKR
jgi:hypothetical protein